MKVYFIYVAIPEKIYNDKIKYLLSSHEYNYRYKNGKMFGLYAFSNKKKLVKEFFDIRNKNIYTLVEKPMDDDSYKKLKNHYKTIELKLYPYIRKDSDGQEKDIYVVSTKNEYVNSTIDHEENLSEFGPESYDFPVTLFNHKVFNALDVLGYTSDYFIRYGTDDEATFENYQLSFGVTGTGRKLIVNPKNTDSFSVLLYLFRFFFLGENYRLEGV